jgi:PilZ domain
MSERRRHPRHSTLKAGRIVFNQRFSVISCTIRNISESGACLQVASSFGIPDCFDLTIEPEPSSRAYEVAWRSEQRIGVAFR